MKKEVSTEFELKKTHLPTDQQTKYVEIMKLLDGLSVGDIKMIIFYIQEEIKVNAKWINPA